MPKAHAFPHNCQASWRARGETISSTAPPQLGETVFKVGRTTGGTCGHYTAINGTEFKAPVSGEIGVWREIKSQDHTIVFGYLDFAKPGDSGAFILDDSGNMMGLLLGGSTAFKTMNFLAVNDLFEDIKSRTGAIKVRLPPGNSAPVE